MNAAAAAEIGRTWPDVLREVVTTPAVGVPLLIGAAALGLLLYAFVRTYGIDPIPPLLARLGFTTVRRAMDISGEWRYRCLVDEEPPRSWGGTLTIHQESTRRSTEWKLDGHRRWEQRIDASGRSVKSVLELPRHWQTTWGSVNERGRVRFGYTTTTSSGNIEGYSYGSIQTVDGRPVRIEGRFFQLPPVEPLQGTVEFRRGTGPGDEGW